MTGVDQMSLVLGFDTNELRRLANGRIGDPTIQHAIDAELLRREQEQELAAYRFRMSLATADQVHEEEARWCCLPGALADAHRAVLADAESRLAHDHALAGGGA